MTIQDLQNKLNKVFADIKEAGFNVTEAVIWPENEYNICADIMVDLIGNKSYQSIIEGILQKIILLFIILEKHLSLIMMLQFHQGIVITEDYQENILLE